MKKILGFLSVLLLGCPFVFADGFKTITLAPGWNVLSTPGILSDITYSNGGEGLSFFKLVNGKWVSISSNSNTISPLNGYLVNNSNANDVYLTLHYSSLTPMGALLTNTVTPGWNFLGITNTSSLVDVNGGPLVDFTYDGKINYLNKVNSKYTSYSYPYYLNVEKPEIGEAYGVYIDYQKEYGGVNNPISDELLCDIIYSSKKPTNENVVVTLNNCKDGITFVNGNSYEFNNNGGHIFEYKDKNSNIGKKEIVVDWIDRESPVCSDVMYSTTEATNQSVTVRLTGCNEQLSGVAAYTFTENGTHTIAYEDLAGNKSEKEITVSWIDKSLPDCVIEYSTTSPTTGNVIATLNCNRDITLIQGESPYTFTGNGSKYFYYEDNLGNYGGITAEVDWIQSELLLKSYNRPYNDTIVTPGSQIVLLSGVLDGLYKGKSDKISFSPTYSLTIEGGNPDTDISNIVSSVFIGSIIEFNVANNWSHYDCNITPNGKTDSQGNAKIYLDFSRCKNSSNGKSQQIFSMPRITKTLDLGVNVTSDAKKGTKIYLDDITTNSISMDGGTNYFIINGGTIPSRKVTVGNAELLLTSDKVGTSINRNNQEPVLLFSGELTTDNNEIEIYGLDVYAGSEFDGKAILYSYVGEEKGSEEYFKDGNAWLWLGKTIHKGEKVGFKIYGTFNPSVSIGSIFHPTVIISSATDENGDSYNSIKPRIEGDDIVVYENINDLDLYSTNQLTDFVTRVSSKDNLFFQGILATKFDDTFINSLKINNIDSAFNDNLKVKIYLNKEFYGEGMVQNGEIIIPLNIEMNKSDAKYIEIYGDFGCYLDEKSILSPTISIGGASVGGVNIETLPSAIGVNVSFSPWRPECSKNF